MAEAGYSDSDVGSLLAGSARKRRLATNYAVVDLAFEIRDYLTRSIARPRASREKLTMGLAVLDIWRSLDGRGESIDASRDDAVAAAVATVGASTARTGSENDDEHEIMASVRRAVEASWVGDDWNSLWEAASGIGVAAGFALDTDAARAERVWAALMAFAGGQQESLQAAVPPHAVDALTGVERRVRATEQGAIDSLRKRLRAGVTPEPSVDGSPPTPPRLYPEVGVRPENGEAEAPEWEALRSILPTDDARRVQVWFGTNREPVSIDPRGGFTNRLADGQLFYGVCQVNLPRVEQVTGGPKAFLSAWLRVGSDRGRTRVERQFRFWNGDEFVMALNEQLNRTPTERGGLVFVHGYATSFSDAVTASADIAVAIKHVGPVAAFSWASKGRRSAYRHDEQIVERSRAQLIEFLHTLIRRANLDYVDVIVHSLGNRLFLRSLRDWLEAEPHELQPMRNVYLGAPDVDQPEFLASSNLFRKAAAKTTLYASDSDSALLASRAIHRGIPRAGLMPPAVTTDELDTIETSMVDLTRIRHSYVIDAGAVRADIFSVQAGLSEPADRPNIHAAGSDLEPDYWRMM